MFGPTETWLPGPTKRDRPRLSHHRSPEFGDFLRRLEALFKERTGVPDDWAVLFIPGSGTLANQCLLASLAAPARCGPDDTTFGRRLIELRRQLYDDQDEADNEHVFWVQYDTASTEYSPPFAWSRGLTFLDCVSAFPYYAPWPGAAGFTTVGGKQLRASPGLSMVCLSPAGLAALHPATTSTLSLASYVGARRSGQTPHTPAIGLLAHLHDRLLAFDLAAFRRTIDDRRAWVAAAAGDRLLPGEGPVVTFREGALPEKFCEAWGLYRGALGPQTFLWNGENRDYRDFCRELRRTRV